MVEAAISKARAIPRWVALKPVVRNKQTRRPAFVVTYDPRLPNITDITLKHWRSMTTEDPYLSEVFSDPPLISYKRQKNIKDLTVNAKVPTPQLRPKRVLKGMKKCNKQCLACPFIMEGKDIKSGKLTWKINKPVNCQTSNIIYMIECNKCNEKYIGETERQLKFRISEHKGYINNNIWSKATGAHFNLPGHSINNMSVTIIEKVKKADESYRKEREKFYIRKFNTFYRGLNRTP